MPNGHLETLSDLGSDASDSVPIGPAPNWGLEAEVTEESVAQRLFGRGKPARLGRFELGDRLGRGGMGEVWAAYDPQLERHVALKTVRLSRAAQPAQRSALIDEARALARVRHENVLSVYDVIEADGAVVVVMEQVDGETLGTWARRRDVSRRDLLAALEAAARGLAAVHAAGLVHLDFKPDNVLVGRDGQVLVADFGLAAPLHRAKTRVGGTPGFAAPEQWDFEARSVDARADQFAFAATLCRLLTGARPLTPPLTRTDASDPDCRAAFRSEVRVLVRRTSLGRGPRAALLRALEWDPNARFESMEALADALFHRPRRRRRQLLGLSAAIIAVASGIAATRLFADTDERPACAGVSAEQWLDDAWDLSQRDGFSNAAARHPSIEPGALRARGRLDDRRRALLAVWPAICEADPHAGDDLRSATRRCMERRRRELVAVAGLLADPSAKTLERAPEIVGSLESMRDCAFDELDAPPLPARTRVELEGLGQAYGLLAEARVHAKAGTRDLQRAAIEAATELAAALDDRELQAAVAKHRGHLRVEDGAIEAGIEDVEAAYFVAVEAGAERLALDTATLLVFLAGMAGQQPERGESWARHARAWLTKLGPDDTRHARLLVHLGALTSQAGQASESLAYYREAVEQLERSDSDDPGLQIAALNGLAIGLETTGAPIEALAIYARLGSLVRDEYGPRHPKYGAILNNMGAAQQAAGDYEAAIASHEYAASVAAEHGLARREHSASLNLCFAHASARHRAQGLPDCDRAIALCLELHDGDAKRCSNGYMALGNTLAQLGRGAEALDAYQHVFVSYAALYEADDPRMAWAHSSLGAGYLAAKDWTRARDHYQTARALAHEADFPAWELAEVEFGLARALHELGESKQAVELARRAADAYAEHGQRVAKDEVDAWLAEVSD